VIFIDFNFERNFWKWVYLIVSKFLKVFRYSSGSINIYTISLDNLVSTSSKVNEIKPFVTFQRHSSPLTCLCSNKNSNLLLSGSLGSDVVIWDVISEKGLTRLYGRLNSITSVNFILRCNIVLT
jgi:WD40 repeat protein